MPGIDITPTDTNWSSFHHQEMTVRCQGWSFSQGVGTFTWEIVRWTYKKTVQGKFDYFSTRW